jgi:dUTP pyrophosphatase
MDRRIQFTKIRDVKSPQRANHNDAGIDFFVPYYSEKFYEDLVKKNPGIFIETKIDEAQSEVINITVPPFGQVNIPSGIKVNILDKNTYLDANNKSGVATKYKLDVGANVVDADYRGEIHLHFFNTSYAPVIIRSGQKIVQFIHKEYIKSDLIEISNKEYDSLEQTDRGEGGFASTGEN